MAAASGAAASGGAAALRRSASSGTLRKSGEMSVAGGGTQAMGETGEALTKFSPPPKIPKYLSVHSLTSKRKLSASTGNLHGFMAEDYHQINWPLPKMFGMEKYGYSLIDITDPRFLKECAVMSKKLVRLSYDQQIIDLEWRKTYKALLDAEHRQNTLPENAQQKTKDILKKEVDTCMKYLIDLQGQKDMYHKEVTDIYARCDEIKRALKKESDLEDLRTYMDSRTKGSLPSDSQFWKTKFNIHPNAGGMGRF